VTRLLESLLFGVKATDPVTFAGVAALVAVVALAASFAPAQRAAGVAPSEALRHQ
jgi:ABC-type lipoprotein release transport system permease subunit